MDSGILQHFCYSIINNPPFLQLRVIIIQPSGSPKYRYVGASIIQGLLNYYLVTRHLFVLI